MLKPQLEQPLVVDLISERPVDVGCVGGKLLKMALDLAAVEVGPAHVRRADDLRKPTGTDPLDHLAGGLPVGGAVIDAPYDVAMIVAQSCSSPS